MTRFPLRQGPITDSLRCGEGTGCDGNRSACGRVHAWHCLPDTMKTRCSAGLDVIVFPISISGYFPSNFTRRIDSRRSPLGATFSSATYRIQALKVALLCAQSPSRRGWHVSTLREMSNSSSRERKYEYNQKNHWFRILPVSQTKNKFADQSEINS